MTIHR